ncbi:hypothetical protein BVG16_04620 [Paenibacillus selenitireducens]|uniref:Holin n=1 Tax=Paenibacillus selenitireducens TaxID=1324314 RepID=A0A1T2XL60_9BACL|nr:hypothetical protein BVG16_04620 [Paenibacillus selenitireducens]
MKKFSIAVLQIGFLYAVYFIMDQAAQALHLPIPGSILGLVLIFILLQTGVIKLTWIERGSNWLLAEMLLFFIPAAAGIIKFKDLMMTNGWSILVVILVSTLIVMMTAGMLPLLFGRQKERNEG